MSLEAKVSDLDCRVRICEVSEAKIIERVDALIKRLDHLSGWIMALVIVILTTVITALSFLINFYVKGGGC